MRPPYLRTEEARRSRRRIEEDPRLAEARLQLLARLRLGPRPRGDAAHVRLLPEVGAHEALAEVEDLRPSA